MKQLSPKELKYISGGRFGSFFWAGFAVYKTHAYLSESGAYRAYGSWSFNKGNFRTSQKL